MPNELYWIGGVWRGKLAVGPRPRGGDWLQNDVATWKRANIDTVLSLLTADEEREMDLPEEANAVSAQGMHFASFPIEDRNVPLSEAEFAYVLDRLLGDLSDGKNVLVHCRQGIGRSGLVAACLLVRKGMSPGAAIDLVSAARGVPVPETAAQKDWIEHYAAASAGAK
jgi:protein-tyrosine phosphatase